MRSLIATVLIAASASLHAGAYDDDVEEIASVVEANYFDEARARAIAADLRAAIRAGELGSASDPRDLAAEMTARLRPHDGHFVVTWASGDSESAPTPSVAPVASPEDTDRRGAYGFRRVEMLPGAVGYIDLRWFADFDFADKNAPARAAADAALALVRGADAVIVDLRDNGGGSPAMVGYLVSGFTLADADIYNEFHSRSGTESERPKTPYAAPRLDVPLYVLISGRTGSAAEAAAYTWQAAKRATIVGEASAGAANPGELFSVGSGFAVFVSTGTPINAVTGSNWEHAGVKPDVPVEPAAALQRAYVMSLEKILTQQPASADARLTLEALQAPTASDTGLTDYSGQYGEAIVDVTGGVISLRRGRRPAMTLVRLAGDSFFVLNEPTRRVVFERGSDGAITGFALMLSTGQSAWFRK